MSQSCRATNVTVLVIRYPVLSLEHASHKLADRINVDSASVMDKDIFDVYSFTAVRTVLKYYLLHWVSIELDTTGTTYKLYVALLLLTLFKSYTP